jgi:large subunit ribosomal protein L22
VPGPKTNERPGTRAVLRHCRMSASKARQVLDLVRGEDVDRAEEILRNTPREAARVVAKVLASAVANAAHNDGLDPEELYVAACYADEGTTLKRWRPRARGRATRIRKRSCHITVIVARLPEDRLARRRARAASAAAQRARRVAASRREEPAAPRTSPTETPLVEETPLAEEISVSEEISGETEEQAPEALAPAEEQPLGEQGAAEAPAEEVGVGGEDGAAGGSAEADQDETED